MNFIINSFTFLLLGSTLAGGQIPDYLRRMIMAMHFEVQSISPVPLLACGVVKASIPMYVTCALSAGDKYP